VKNQRSANGVDSAEAGIVSTGTRLRLAWIQVT